MRMPRTVHVRWLAVAMLAIAAGVAALVLRSRATAEAGRRAGVALAAGKTEPAAAALIEALQHATGQRDPLAAIRKSEDAALLTDFSAAALERAGVRSDARDVLLAFESADRAWRLGRGADAAWNRAVAAERIGVPGATAAAWRVAVTAAADASSSWSREAGLRYESAARVAAAPLSESAEAFFHRTLVARSKAMLLGESRSTDVPEVRDADPIAGDHLASDTLAAVRRERSAGERARAVSALQSYTDGRNAFENDALDEAHRAFSRAESELQALGIPLALLARDQRIRCQCSQASQPGCIEELSRFREELLASGRYPWLAARAAYARGQANYRRGRIYEAAEWFQRGQEELHRLHDPALESVTHSMLANAYAAAGETEAALNHFLRAIRTRYADIGDRRRRQLEDVTLFLLRHGFVASAELLLDEMAPSPSTDAGRVLESTLRGIAAARRGDRSDAERHFRRSHVLLASVEDENARANAQRSLAIAESELHTLSSRGLGELDAAIARHEDDHYRIWLPQLLAQRGAVLEARNELARAEADYRRAIELLEQREPRIDQSVLSLGAASDDESPFDRLIRLLLRQQRIAAALSIAERSGMLRISSLHAHEAGVRDVFDAARGAAGGDGIAAVQQVLGADQVAVVQYLLRDELITWLVARTEIRAFRRRVNALDLAVAVAELPESGDLNFVSSQLLRDWIERVPRETTLLIQPPVELQAVPLAMLMTREGERLLARNPVTTTPSLRAFARAVRIDGERAGQTTAFFAAASRPGGDREPLPSAVSEVTRASRFYPGAVVETHATRERFLARSAEFAVVHFAGHVLVNDRQPLRSTLVFDADEPETQYLQMHELDEPSFARARLVVLSGCETGRAPHPTMSIANALLSQGVPSVVYTYWPVEDDAAEKFALAFHRAVAAGRPRAAAVRDAQLSMMRAHADRPDRWASFALAGAPGPVRQNEREKTGGQ